MIDSAADGATNSASVLHEVATILDRGSKSIAPAT